MKRSIIALTLVSIFTASVHANSVDIEELLQKDPYATATELGIMEGLVVPTEKQVTKENALQTPPYNRWSYQHMRMFYPSADIAPSKSPVSLKKNIQDLSNIKVKNGQGEERTFEQFLTETWTDSLIVIKGDKIVSETYMNGMAPDTPHQMMSVTKSFGGLMALMAIDKGKFKESDPVTMHVPELKAASGFANATVQQVLNMTNSMDFTEHYADSTSGIRTYGAVLGWTEKVEGVEYPDNLYKYLQTLEIDNNHKHGEIFHYQTPKTDVVNWITNRANGTNFQGSLEKELWSKLGTEGETYVLLDNNANLVAGGGLNATPMNLAKFATMMLNDGEFNGQQVVSKEVIDQIANGGNKLAFANGPDASANMPGGEWSYRAQWWVKHTPGQEAFMAIGIHGQWIYIDRGNDIAIVKQSSAPDSVTLEQEAYDLNGLYAIVKALSE
ncbi:beta-lactamase family protein [Vibrio mediterranei]|nr:beta-lactamase family protein [Vibrio mediterranei]